MAEEGKNQATVACDKKGDDFEFELFEGGASITLYEKRLYPPPEELGSAWLQVSAEFALEGSLSFTLKGATEEQGEAEIGGWKQSFINQLSAPIEQLVGSFQKATWSDPSFGLKGLKIGSLDKNGDFTVGEFTIGSAKATLPAFPQKAKEGTETISVSLTLTMVTINFKNNISQVFPVGAQIEIPLLVWEPPPKWVASGDIKLSAEVSAGINGYMIAKQMGQEIEESAEDEAEGALAAIGLEACCALAGVAVVLAASYIAIQEDTSMEEMRDGIPKMIDKAEQDYIDGLLYNKNNGNEFIDKGVQDRMAIAQKADKYLQDQGSKYSVFQSDGSFDPDYASSFNASVSQNQAKIKANVEPDVKAAVEKYAWFQWAKLNPDASVPTRHAVFNLVPTLGVVGKDNFNYTQCYPNEFSDSLF